MMRPGGFGRRALAVTVAMLALVTGSPTLSGVAHATYAGVNGSYAYFRDGAIRTHDGTTERLVLTAHPLGAEADWSPDGRKLAYAAAGAGGLLDIFTINADGTGPQNVTNTAGVSEQYPNWSPDGGRLVFTGDSVRVEAINADGTFPEVLRTGTTFLSDPVWDPSGNTIVYSTRVGAAAQLIAMNSDGTGSHQLTNAATSSSDPDYSPDGSKIAFTRNAGAENAIWVMDAGGGNQHSVWATPPFNAENPSWSPDGTKILFQGDSGSTSAIRVINADGSGSASTIATGAFFPDWGPQRVPDDPVISATGSNVSGTEGAALTSATVATFTDADAGGVAGDYTASIDWGDGDTSSGTVSGSSGSYTVTGSHTYEKYGSYTVTVTITDTNNNVPDSATVTPTATIADAALTASGKGTVPSPQAFSGAVASFTDANPFGDASEFTATIDWGDGSSPTAGAVASNGSGGYDVTGTHQYTSTGPFSASVAITSTGGSTASATTTVLVYGTASRGGFVIGDRNSANGTAVTFWGSQWAKRNALSGGSAPSSFKGFAAAPTTLPACGQGWSTSVGNSPPPPPGPLPAYMAVIVTSAATQSSVAVTGNTAHLVVVRVNPGYAPDPKSAGTGTVVAQIC